MYHTESENDGPFSELNAQYLAEERSIRGRLRLFWYGLAGSILVVGGSFALMAVGFRNEGQGLMVVGMTSAMLSAILAGAEEDNLYFLPLHYRIERSTRQLQEVISSRRSRRATHGSSGEADIPLSTEDYQIT